MKFQHATLAPWLGGLTGLLPALLVGGMVCVAVLAAAGLWQLTWVVHHVSSILERQPAREAAARVVPVPVAVVSEAGPARADQHPALPDSATSAPRVRLEDPTPIPDVSLPSFAPPACRNMFVYITSISPRFPEHSAASIASGPSAPGRFRRIGQKIDDWEVTAIRDDGSGLNPEVWLSRGKHVCKAELAGNPARVKPEPAIKRRKRKGRRRK